MLRINWKKKKKKKAGGDNNLKMFWKEKYQKFQKGLYVLAFCLFVFGGGRDEECSSSMLYFRILLYF